MSEKTASDFNWKRIVVAAAILPVLAVYLYYLPPMPYFLALLTVVCVMAMNEFYTMYGLRNRFIIPGVLIGGGIFYIICLHSEFFLEALFLGFLALFLLRLFDRQTPEGSMSEIGPLGTGFFYIGIFLSFQWFLRIDAGVEYIFLLYVSVWFADSMAYYIGKYLGKHKLFPSVSPNKTMEGAFGSLLGGSAGAVMITIVMNIQGLSASGAAATGVALGLATVLGDLIESMFKRDAGVKDSGNLIPGHGGFLDKIDGFLVAGPALYFIVRFL
ncbi:MAG: phosphatidate cytidylyltransferase [Nitrospiraceae bacterium]|nr:MAG: phosphatidate cytidylyltransferase [Nitrospiraceae bacterium]